MPKITPFAVLAGAVLLAGCTETMGARPVDVTRYHLGQPIGAGTVAVEPMTTVVNVTPEYQSYADAVGARLGQIGLTPAVPNAPSTFIAAVSYIRTPEGPVRKRPPITIGLGAGSFGGGYGGGVGVGGGATFGIGGGRAEAISTELWVQLRRRSDGTIVWEGKARTDGLAGASNYQPGAVATRLADAMFKGFPGESGITITVK